MKSTDMVYWEVPNVGATNESGFSALPVGCRDVDGSFDGVREGAFFWCATEIDKGLAWSLLLSYDSCNVFRISDDKSFGFSVRCLRD